MAAAFAIHRKRGRELSEKTTHKVRRGAEAEEEREGHTEDGRKTASKVTGGGSAGACPGDESSSSAVVLMHANRTQFATKARRLRPFTLQGGSTGGQTKMTSSEALLTATEEDQAAETEEMSKDEEVHTRQRRIPRDEKSDSAIPRKKVRLEGVPCVPVHEASTDVGRERELGSWSWGTEAKSPKEKELEATHCSQQNRTVIGTPGEKKGRDTIQGEGSPKCEEQQGQSPSVAGGGAEVKSPCCPLAACPRCHLLTWKRLTKPRAEQEQEGGGDEDPAQEGGREGGMREDARAPCSELTVEMMDGACEFNQGECLLASQNAFSSVVSPSSSPCWRWKIIAISVYLGGFSRRFEKDCSLLRSPHCLLGSDAGARSNSSVTSSPSSRYLSSPSLSSLLPSGLPRTPVYCGQLGRSLTLPSETLQRPFLLPLADPPPFFQTSQQVGGLLLSLVRATIDLLGIPFYAGPPSPSEGSKDVQGGREVTVLNSPKVSRRCLGEPPADGRSSFISSYCAERRQECRAQEGIQQEPVAPRGCPASQQSPFGTPLTMLLSESLHRRPAEEGERDVYTEAGLKGYTTSGSPLDPLPADDASTFSHHCIPKNRLAERHVERQARDKQIPSQSCSFLEETPSDSIPDICPFWNQTLYVPCGRVRPFDFLSRARLSSLHTMDGEAKHTVACSHEGERAPRKQSTRRANRRPSFSRSQEVLAGAGSGSPTPCRRCIPRGRMHSLIYGIRVDYTGRRVESVAGGKCCGVTQGRAEEGLEIRSCQHDDGQNRSALRSKEDAASKSACEAGQDTWTVGLIRRVVPALVEVTQTFLERLLSGQEEAEAQTAGALPRGRRRGCTSTETSTAEERHQAGVEKCQPRRLKTRRKIEDQSSLEPGDATVSAALKTGPVEQETSHNETFVLERNRECFRRISTTLQETAPTERSQVRFPCREEISGGDVSGYGVSPNAERGNLLAVIVRCACTRMLYAVLVLLAELYLTVQAVDARQDILLAHTPTIGDLPLEESQAPPVSAACQVHRESRTGKRQKKSLATECSARDCHALRTVRSETASIVSGSPLRQSSSKQQQTPARDETRPDGGTVKQQIADPKKRSLSPEDNSGVALEAGPPTVGKIRSRREKKETQIPGADATGDPEATDGRTACLAKKASSVYTWLCVCLSRVRRVVTAEEPRVGEGQVQPGKYPHARAPAASRQHVLSSRGMPPHEQCQEEAVNRWCRRLHDSKLFGTGCALGREWHLNVSGAELDPQKHSPICSPLSGRQTQGLEDDWDTLEVSALAKEFVDGAMSNSALSWILSLSVARLLGIARTSARHI